MSHQRTLRRYRRQTLSTNPRSMTEFDTQLNEDYAHLCRVNDVSLYSGIIGNTPQEGVTLLFILPEVKNIFRTGSMFVFDGSFSSVPSFGNECQQLYIIMGFAFNTGFPIGFALMSEKTENAYTALFNEILSLVPEWQPNTIVIDFDRAAISSIRTLFPNAVIRGCWFHSSQDIWREVGTNGLTELCTHNRTAYDIVHMLMALPLLPQHLILEGFESVQQVYNENLQLSTGAHRGQFNRLFDYFRSTWLQENNADRFSASDTVWCINNVLEVSHQNLLIHMGNRHHPEPWEFMRGLVTYARGVILDYSAVTVGVQLRETHRQVWIYYQRSLDLAMRLLIEGSYSVLAFLVSSRNATPNFGIPQPQGFDIPAGNVPSPPSPILVELPPRQSREEIIERLLPQRIRQPVPRNLFEMISDSDEEENVIARPQDQSQNGNLIIFDLYDSDEELNAIDRSQAIRPQINRVRNEDLNIVPIVERQCSICMSTPPTVIASPCFHQCLCENCFTRYFEMPPYSSQPYYRCPLCRGQIQSYIILF